MYTSINVMNIIPCGKNKHLTERAYINTSNINWPARWTVCKWFKRDSILIVALVWNLVCRFIALFCWCCTVKSVSKCTNTVYIGVNYILSRLHAYDVFLQLIRYNNICRDSFVCCFHQELYSLRWCWCSLLIIVPIASWDVVGKLKRSTWAHSKAAIVFTSWARAIHVYPVNKWP